MRASETRIVDFALKNHLPSVFTRIEAVNSGGLLYYGADITESYRRIAYYIEKILKGAKPADLPVEQSTQFELLINMKTAKSLGVAIPNSVFLRADEVIQ